MSLAATPRPRPMLRGCTGCGRRVCASAKLTVELVRWVRSEHTKGRSITSLAQEVGVCRASVSKAINGGSWRHVS